jgi:hypothetical protein
VKKALAIAASIALVAVGLFVGRPSGGASEIHLFSGKAGAWAFTADRSAANLPARYRPWKFVETYNRSHFWFGRDNHALAEVDARGYSLSIVQVTEEPPPPSHSD